MKVIVPATSANLGCGFDSVGLAVNLYLELEILEACKQWEIIHDMGASVPHDEKNLIISTALGIAPGLSPHKIRMTSDIPLTGGLGSSSSAIVAGIELACAIGNAELSTQEKLQLACKLEGHPDNVVPAILGGLVISTYVNGNLEYVEVDIPNVGLVAYIPGYRSPTEAMRDILPAGMPYYEAVWASSISNVMIASLMRGDMSKAGRMMESDLFHEKYRAGLVPELSEVRVIARKHGAYATYLSGAGSAIMCITEMDKVGQLAAALPRKSDARILKLLPEPNGAGVVL